MLVERDRLGGTCLNIGCIPSKALIHVADAFEQARGHAGEAALGIRVRTPEIDIAKSVAWKDGIVDRLTRGVGALLKKNGVRVLHGEAQVVDGKTVDVVGGGHTTRISCEHLLLATGSEPVALPSMPFGGHVVSSTEALSPETLPKRLVVVGAGYIGLELGIVYRKLGVDVSVVEAAERVLPAYDAELARPVADSLARLGVRLLLGHKVLGRGARRGARAGRRWRGADAAGRPRAGGGGPPAACRRLRAESLPLDRNGRALWIDDECRTSMRNVWAIGDVAGEPMLAHCAMAQGEMVAELIAGKRRKFVPASIPAVCFTDPEIVTAGWSPDDARAADVDCVSASFPFAANGRAMTLQATDVRCVARVSRSRLETGARVEARRHASHERRARAARRAGTRCISDAYHT